jgi:WD40 repeat protein
LGSVGRDRIFCLFKKDASDKQHPYKLIFSNQSHSRVIYSLNFTLDNKFVLTGSRDKKLKIWNLGEDKVALA